jgi:hypothetical protein
MVWERQRHVLHALSIEWLDTGMIQGRKAGIFRTDLAGTIVEGMN